MDIPSMDFGTTLLFLFSMIAVARFKKQLSEVNIESYKNITGGLAILSIITLMKIYSNLGVFESIPFISESLFFRLIYWIGVITGVTFLITGISVWLPLSRSYRKYNKFQIQRLEFIKKVAQLVRVETRTHIILEKTLDYKLEHYNLLKGAVYAFSKKKNEMVYIASSVDGDISANDLKQITFNIDTVSDFLNYSDLYSHKLIEKLPSMTTMPEILIPITVANHLVGVFLLWEKASSRLNDDEKINLKIAADIIAHKIQTDRLAIKSNFQKEQREWLKTLTVNLDYDKDIKENISTVIHRLKEKVKLDLFILTIVQTNKHVQRYTLGKNNSLLSETVLDFYQTPTVTNYIYDNSQSVIVNDIEKNKAITVDEVVYKSGMKSMIALPVTYGSTVEGVVTFAGQKNNSFNSRESSFINTILPVIANLVRNEKYCFSKKIQEKRRNMLDSFMSEVVQTKNLQDIFNRTASLISGELKPTMVRISTFDAENTFLNSRSMELTRNVKDVTPRNASMVLSLMPYHQLVRETGKTMMVNQESTDRRIAEPEMRQMFGPHLKSALLVPVKIGSSSLAIISLVEMRKWYRYPFLLHDIQFVTSLASILAMAIQLQLKQKMSKDSDLNIPNNIKTDQIDLERKSRIRSSLTGIIGSVELLMQSEQPTNENLRKYLSIIDKSAHRINEYIISDVK